VYQCIWLLLSSIICSWDAVFILNRPTLNEHFIWSPYKNYVQVDFLYDDLDNRFLEAQALMNFVEIAINLSSLLVLRRGHDRTAAAMMLIASAMTMSKTMLYFTMEACCGFRNTRHNDAVTMMALYVLPNGIWIFFPMLVLYELVSALETAQSKRN